MASLAFEVVNPLWHKGYIQFLGTPMSLRQDKWKNEIGHAVLEQ